MLTELLQQQLNPLPIVVPLVPLRPSLADNLSYSHNMEGKQHTDMNGKEEMMEAADKTIHNNSFSIAGNAKDLDSSLATRLRLPRLEASYLNHIVDILRDDLGQYLVGVYLFGSAAYSEYELGISDLDVQAVVDDALDSQTCRRIAEHLTHEQLACPARRLEFVIYGQHAVKPASRHPQFQLNFNTGGDDPDHFVTDPAHEASHWFLLDIAMGRALGQRLFGPAPADVFDAIPRLWQLEAIADSLRWHITNEMTSTNNVLNACRGWRYAATGQQGSKRAGAVWALQQPQCPLVVEEAIHQRRHAGLPLDKIAVSKLIEIVLDAVQTAIRNEH